MRFFVLPVVAYVTQTLNICKKNIVSIHICPILSSLTITMSCSSTLPLITSVANGSIRRTFALFLIIIILLTFFLLLLLLFDSARPRQWMNELPAIGPDPSWDKQELLKRGSLSQWTPSVTDHQQQASLPRLAQLEDDIEMMQFGVGYEDPWTLGDAATALRRASAFDAFGGTMEPRSEWDTMGTQDPLEDEAQFRMYRQLVSNPHFAGSNHPDWEPTIDDFAGHMGADEAPRQVEDLFSSLESSEQAKLRHEIDQLKAAVKVPLEVSDVLFFFFSLFFFLYLICLSFVETS